MKELKNTQNIEANMVQLIADEEHSLEQTGGRGWTAAIDVVTNTINNISITSAVSKDCPRF